MCPNQKGYILQKSWHIQEAVWSDIMRFRCISTCSVDSMIYCMNIKYQNICTVHHTSPVYPSVFLCARLSLSLWLWTKVTPPQSCLAVTPPGLTWRHTRWTQSRYCRHHLLYACLHPTPSNNETIETHCVQSHGTRTLLYRASGCTIGCCTVKKGKAAILHVSLWALSSPTQHASCPPLTQCMIVLAKK